MIQVALVRCSSPRRLGPALYAIELRNVPARGHVVVSRACEIDKAQRLLVAWENALDAFHLEDDVRERRAVPTEPDPPMDAWQRLRHPFV